MNLDIPLTTLKSNYQRGVDYIDSYFTFTPTRIEILQQLNEIKNNLKHLNYRGDYTIIFYCEEYAKEDKEIKSLIEEIKKIIINQYIEYESLRLRYASNNTSGLAQVQRCIKKDPYDFSQFKHPFLKLNSKEEEDNDGNS